MLPYLAPLPKLADIEDCMMAGLCLKPAGAWHVRYELKLNTGINGIAA